MHQFEEYIAVLRCQTWNVWPEKTGIEHQPFAIEYGASEPLPARLIVISYAQRGAAECYLNEKTDLGPLLWDGETRGLHRLRDAVLKAPEDQVQVAWQYRNVERGEIDICINFRWDGQPPDILVEALRGTAYAIMSLANLKLRDCITPATPFQLLKILADGRNELESAIRLAVCSRQALSKEILKPTIASVANVLLKSIYGKKLRLALELYGAHFTERQVRVRFLLLVMAMEALVSSTPKHQTAINLLTRWRGEIENEMSRHGVFSEEFLSLEALSRELGFRGEDSIRTQVRKLFAGIPGVTSEQVAELQRRALRVYDGRSTLVHQGHLPTDELYALEVQARELLENVFAGAIDQSDAAMLVSIPVKDV